ncbi:MAG: calcium-binding protein, partial [Microcystaceae cyanobacterium]
MATRSGTNANDVLIGGLGNDVIEGNDGNDTIISRSDAGEPEIAQDSNVAKVYPDQPYQNANDTLSGGNGADTFVFNPLINAKTSIIEKHVDAETGDINWGMNGVAGENNNTHDHWVDSIGDDVILDYNQAEGDLIQISGHTTEVANIQYVDVDGDGTEESIIQLISNQGGAGAHDGDLLGTITVFGDRITEADLVVQKTDLGALQFDDAIVGTGDNDKLYGDIGNDTLDGGSGDDTLNGGSGDDELIGGTGSDRLKGKAGNDILNGNSSDDSLFGGSGDDTLYGGS